MEFDKKICPILDIDGVMGVGKQYDLDIKLPDDDRGAVFGIVKDCFGEPICDAVVKLIEIDLDCGKKTRKPVSHTFTDKEGEFVFGPLCPHKSYEVQIWVNKVKHYKICASCHHEGKCLKGVKLDCPDYSMNNGKNEKKECQ